LAFQVDFLFRNLRAKLPAEELNSPRSTLLRPVIGYVNEHRPLIPLSCHFVLDRGAFEGAWSGYECGLVGQIVGGLEGAFSKLVWDPERRMQRITRIGRWTLNNYLKGA
jgi:distribution and morphology protein 31